MTSGSPSASLVVQKNHSGPDMKEIIRLLEKSEYHLVVNILPAATGLTTDI